MQDKATRGRHSEDQVSQIQNVGRYEANDLISSTNKWHRKECDRSKETDETWE